MEALQGSVETLKAEKVEIQNELNILKRESKSDVNSTNNQMEMEMEKAEKYVDPEKLGVQIESLSEERMGCGGEMGLTETKKNSMETENDPLVDSLQGDIDNDMQIELEAVRDRKRRENPAENSSLVDSVETSIGNIQLDFETLKAEQVDPLVDEGNRDKLPTEKINLSNSALAEAHHEEREEEQKSGDGETEQSPLLESETLKVKQSSLLETLKVENASLLQAVESLSSEKAEMHQFHSQVGRHKANTLIMMPDESFRICMTLIVD